MYAEVVTNVAGSLEAVGLPGYPEVFICWNKRDEVLTKLCSTLFYKNMKRREVINFIQNVYMFKILQERKMVRLYR